MHSSMEKMRSGRRRPEKYVPSVPSLEEGGGCLLACVHIHTHHHKRYVIHAYNYRYNLTWYVLQLRSCEFHPAITSMKFLCVSFFVLTNLSLIHLRSISEPFQNSCHDIRSLFKTLFLRYLKAIAELSLMFIVMWSLDSSNSKISQDTVCTQHRHTNTHATAWCRSIQDARTNTHTHTHTHTQLDGARLQRARSLAQATQPSLLDSVQYHWGGPPLHCVAPPIASPFHMTGILKGILKRILKPILEGIVKETLAGILQALLTGIPECILQRILKWILKGILTGCWKEC